MLGELAGELAPTARILVLELHARRAERIALCHLGHALLLDLLRGGVGLGAELLALGGLRAIAATAHDEGKRPLCVGDAEMQRGETAHGEAADMGLVDAQVVEDRTDVVARQRLRVFFRILRHVRWRIAARVERDAAVITREEPHLRLPAAIVTGVLVDEEERLAAARFLEIELHAVVGGGMRHRFLLYPMTTTNTCMPCLLIKADREVFQSAQDEPKPLAGRGERLRAVHLAVDQMGEGTDSVSVVENESALERERALAPVTPVARARRIDIHVVRQIKQVVVSHLARRRG